MRDAGSETPRDRLLAAGRRAGFRVSESQLHRYQQRGIIPPPRQVPLGRGKGTRTVYPPGTAEHFIALCRQLKKERSFTTAAWVLW